MNAFIQRVGAEICSATRGGLACSLALLGLVSTPARADATSAIPASGAAQTQTPPAPTDQNDELGALRRTLSSYAEHERNESHLLLHTSLVFGSASLVSGIGLMSSNRQDGAIGPVLTGGGAAILLTSGLALFGAAGGGSFSDLELYARETAAKTPDRAIAASKIRREWDRRAAVHEFDRTLWGYTLLGLSAASAGVGTYIALSPSIRDSPTGDYAGVALAASAWTMIYGVSNLAEPTRLESGREAYEASWPRISAGVAPLPGGGAMSLSGSF